MQSHRPVLKLSGADLGGGAPGPPSPIFACKIFYSPIFALMTILTSSNIDLKCLFCAYVTVKIQFDNTSTCTWEYVYSLYSPSARLLCSIA